MIQQQQQQQQQLSESSQTKEYEARPAASAQDAEASCDWKRRKQHPSEEKERAEEAVGATMEEEANVEQG
eukprot:432925-Hanusia_phi.AAC.1